jgi:2,4-dienoyl-CoA reductase-like NADH-dependent reductase (Old Yellow Enzyme family)
MADTAAFDQPIKVGKVTFRNRLLRSSVGGRTCNYDGTVTDVWKNFERRFAHGGVGGIVSTTFHVNKARLSPPQYPSIASSKHVHMLRRYLPPIQAMDCRYIIQIGDPGYTTYSSLFSQELDGLSASAGFDLSYGYTNTRRAMTVQEVRRSIAEHAAAAARVREAGADGVEITASKGYLIHQFLNPAINLRTDEWGGSEDGRFRFLDEVVSAVRGAVGPDFLLGVRIAASDFNWNPLPLALGRWPSPLLLPGGRGNDQAQMLRYAERLQGRIDYLHVVAGFGFPNPHDVPGEFPFEEIRMFFDSVRHLSGKAALRAAAAHVVPAAVSHALLNIGWGRRQPDLARAAAFKTRLPHMTVIANGGFEARQPIEDALAGAADMVSMARALIATPLLIPQHLRPGRELSDQQRCSRCNRCVGRTTTSPLGCYDLSRFRDQPAMERQILRWNRPDL